MSTLVKPKAIRCVLKVHLKSEGRKVKVTFLCKFHHCLLVLCPDLSQTGVVAQETYSKPSESQ